MRLSLLMLLFAIAFENLFYGLKNLNSSMVVWYTINFEKFHTIKEVLVKKESQQSRFY